MLDGAEPIRGQPLGVHFDLRRRDTDCGSIEPDRLSDHVERSLDPKQCSGAIDLDGTIRSWLYRQHRAWQLESYCGPKLLVAELNLERSRPGRPDAEVVILSKGLEVVADVMKSQLHSFQFRALKFHVSRVDFQMLNQAFQFACRRSGIRQRFEVAIRCAHPNTS